MMNDDSGMLTLFLLPSLASTSQVVELVGKSASSALSCARLGVALSVRAREVLDEVHWCLVLVVSEGGVW